MQLGSLTDSANFGVNFRYKAHLYKVPLCPVQ